MTRFWPVTIFIVGCSLAVFWLAFTSDSGPASLAFMWSIFGGSVILNIATIFRCWENTRDVQYIPKGYYINNATYEKLKNLKDKNGNPVILKEETK